MTLRTQVGILGLAAVLAMPAFGLQKPQDNRSSNRNQSKSSPSANRAQGPGPHAGDWLRRNMNTPPEQQKRELESSDDFKKLPPERQQQLLNRLNRFDSMSPAQKQRMITHMEWLDRLSPEQRKKADDLHNRFHSLTPERRIAVRGALYGMRDMTPDERQKQIESPQMKTKYSDNEREIMKGYTDLGFPDAHGEDGGSPQL